jgi:hypothetical protein
MLPRQAEIADRDVADRRPADDHAVTQHRPCLFVIVLVDQVSQGVHRRLL